MSGNVRAAEFSVKQFLAAGIMSASGVEADVRWAAESALKRTLAGL